MATGALGLAVDGDRAAVAELKRLFEGLPETAEKRQAVQQTANVTGNANTTTQIVGSGNTVGGSA